MSDADSTGSSAPLPPAGWYPDPIGLAEHRYWNGVEWTTNTRGLLGDPEAAAPSSSAETATPVAPASLMDEPADEANAPQVTASEAPIARHATADLSPQSDDPTVDLWSQDPDEPASAVEFWAQGAGRPPDGGGDRAVSGVAATLIGVVAVVAVAVGGYFAFTRLSSGSTLETDAGQATTTSVAGEVQAGSSSEVDPEPAEGQGAEVESLRNELATAQADLAAAEEALAAAEVRATEAEEHVVLMRSWFAADIIARADNLFEAEVQRACAAEAEPTLENTTWTRFMGPAGTHNQLVSAAAECRAGGGG